MKKRYICRLMSAWIVYSHTRQCLKRMLKEGITYKLVRPDADLRNFYIVHPSAKCPGRIQATFFLDGDPISDIIRDTIGDIASELTQLGYTKIIEKR